MDILQFLTFHANNVITFFETKYHQVVALVDNFWNWLNQEVNRAINTARNFATNLVNNAVNLLTQGLNTVRALANNLFTSAINLANQALQAAKNFLLQKIQEAIALVNSLFSSATNLINQALALAQEFAAGLVNQAIDLVMGIFEWVLTLRERITIIVAFLVDGVLSMIQWLFQEGVPFLTAFLRDPTGFLAAWLGTFLLEFLEFLIGYALGSTDQPLPPWPSFSGRTTNPFPHEKQDSVNSEHIYPGSRH